jgi:hypothetical protein
MKRTRKCKCGHTWNEHEALTDGFGRTFITCMHTDRENGDLAICSCKQWDPANEEEVSVPSSPA